MLLAEQLERTLLRLVTGLYKVLKSLLARRVGLAANNAALVEHQVLLVKTAARVGGRSVPYLGTAADRDRLAAHLGKRGYILTRRVRRGVLRRIHRVLVLECHVLGRIRRCTKPRIHVYLTE